MIDFKRILQESKDKKFDAIANKKQGREDSHTCNYSPKSHHKYCTHAHCIFDKEWQEQDKQRTIILNQIKEEEAYLKNGKGEKDYDFQTVYKNVLRLKNKLKDLGR